MLNIKTMMRVRAGWRGAAMLVLLALLVVTSVPHTGSILPQVVAAEVLAPNATSYYVNSISGSDSNSGTSPDRAWRSLSPVRSHPFAPGDTIHLSKGSSWSGGLVISRSGTQGNPITFTTYGSGNRPVITHPNGWANIELRANWVVIEGLLLRDSPEAGVAISGERNIIRDIEVTDSGSGVTVRGPYNTVTNNYIHDLKMVRNTPGGDDDYGAVAIWLHSANNVVSYNRLINLRAPSYDYGHDGGGVELYGSNIDNNYIHHNYIENADGVIEIGGRSGSAANNTVAYNVLVNNHGRVLTVHLSGTYGSTITNFRFENNTIVESDPSNLGLFWFSANPSAGAINMRNNIFYKNGGTVSNRDGYAHTHNLYYFTGGATLGGISLGANEQVANPQFVNLNGGDFRLQSTSPAINRGVNLNYTQDYNNAPVPQGSAPDLGAFEFGASAPPPAPTATPPAATPIPTATPDPNEIIIDNSDARFTLSSSQDAWEIYTLARGQHYGGSHAYNVLSGTGADTATWTFAVPQPGSYEVYAWWWEGDWRPTDVPYTIHHNEGAQTVRVNQQVNGGQWNALGTFNFTGTNSIVVSDDVTSGQDIVADAVRLVYRAPLSAPPTPTPDPTAVEIIIDDTDARFTARGWPDGWLTYTDTEGQHYGGSHHYNAQPANGQAWATWAFTVPHQGEYDVYAWWYAGSWRPTDVPYTINHRDGPTTVRVDQQRNGGMWVLLGRYGFNSSGSVTISNDVTNGQDICADAIRLVAR